MDDPRLDVQLLAAALWQRAQDRVSVSTERRPRDYRKGRPHYATVRSAARPEASFNDPEAGARCLSGSGESEAAALAALRERLLRLLASHAASLTETAGRCDAMASRCRNRAHDLAALVASTRRAVADAASAGEGGPCPS